MRIEEIIKRELMRLPRRNEKGDNIYICCPFHNEKTPSFGVNMNPNLIKKGKKVPLGYGYCFGCGGKGNWNEIAEKLGLQQLKQMKKDGSFKEDYISPLSEKTKKSLLGKSEGLTVKDLEKEWDCLLSRPIEKTESWRNIKGKLLNKIGSLVTVDAHDNKCLFLPTFVNGELVGAQKALWEKHKKFPSYLNYKGEWIKERGLFPFDYTMKLKTKYNYDYVVLVEGARDALVLLQKKVPALAILGTNNWSESKLDLLLFSGVKKVYVMMDADEAGVSAGKKISNKCKEKVKTINVRLDKIQIDISGKFEKKEAWDAASMPDDVLKNLVKQF